MLDTSIIRHRVPNSELSRIKKKVNPKWPSTVLDRDTISARNLNDLKK